MNHAYRIVWNPALACWQAVAEIARSFGKSASGKPLLLALSLLAAPAWAGPQSGQVTAGSATIQQSGTTTTINQSSAKAAIDWSSFSVGKSEAVRFNQPSASAITLNRVTGSESSQILGSLTANGQVFILNPNGVLFGQGAQVNVGGLVASTRNISNADFMAGNYQLTGSGTGSVVNQGTITVPEGGTIVLIAPVVQNTGTLNAPQGNVLLAAADAVTLKLQDGSLIGYTLDKGSLQALVDNGGLILANGGHVILTAKGLDALAKATINHSGVIEAQTVSSRNGIVELLGDMQTGEINLSGKIDASAPTGGNGGFVETSAAHVNLKDGQHVTTMSAMGKTGTWLIDPYDWIIAPSGGGATGTQISGMLENSDVTLRTTGVGINQINPQGDIVINDAISWNSGNTLSLIADRNVDINRSISGATLSVVAPGALTISGTGSVTMRQAIEYRTDNILLHGPSTAAAVGIAIYPFTTTRDVRIETNRTSNALSISPTEIRNFLHSPNGYGIGIGGSSGSLVVDAPLQGSDIDAMDLSLNGNAIILNAAVSLGNKGLSLINMTGGTTIINAPISSDAYVDFVLGNSTVSQTANGRVSANEVEALGTGNVLLHGARNRIQNVSADISGTFWILNDDTPLVVSNTPWSNGIRAFNIGLYTASGLTLNAPIVATGSGDVSVGTLSFVDPLCSGPCIRPHIELGVGQYFTNNVGASALTVPDGKFWSLVANSPSTTRLNGLVPGAVSYYTDSINGDILLSANRVFYGNHDEAPDDNDPVENPLISAYVTPEKVVSAVYASYVSAPSLVVPPNSIRSIMNPLHAFSFKATNEVSTDMYFFGKKKLFFGDYVAYSGYAIDGYSQEILNNGNASIDFPVYNTRPAYLAIQVFSENGVLIDTKYADPKVVEDTTSNISGAIEDLWNKEAGIKSNAASEKTDISIVVPPGGYFKFSYSTTEALYRNFVDPGVSAVMNLLSVGDGNSVANRQLRKVVEGLVKDALSPILGNILRGEIPSRQDVIDALNNITDYILPVVEESIKSGVTVMAEGDLRNGGKVFGTTSRALLKKVLTISDNTTVVLNYLSAAIELASDMRSTSPSAYDRTFYVN